MKKIKILICIFFICLLAGCSADVTLDISPSYMTEKIVLEASKSNIFDNSFKEQIEDNKKFLETYGYSYKFSSTLFTSKVTLTRRVNINHKQINFFPEEYADVLYTGLDNNYVLFSVENINIFDKYDNLEKISISIKTKYKVTNHNADEVKNGEYIWELTPEKKGNINLVIINDIDENNIEKSNNNQILIFVLISLIIVGIVSLILSIIKNSSNIKNRI